MMNVLTSYAVGSGDFDGDSRHDVALGQSESSLAFVFYGAAAGAPAPRSSALSGAATSLFGSALSP